MIAELILVALAQTITLTPDVVHIPPGQQALDKWPDYEQDPRCGHETYIIEYVTAVPFAANGSIEIGFGYRTADLTNPVYAIRDGFAIGPTGGMAKFPVDRFQRSNKFGANYTTAICDQCAVTTALDTAGMALGGERLFVVKLAAAVNAGAKITIVFGDTSKGGPGALNPWTPGRPQLAVWEDPDADGVYVLTAGTLPALLHTAETCDGFFVDLPINPVVDVPFEFTVRAMQGQDNPGFNPVTPCEDYSGTVGFSATSTDADLPSNRTFDPGQHGVRRLQATFHHGGPQQIRVTSASLGTFLSNVAFVVMPGDPHETLVGDLHRHSSNGGHASMPDAYVWQELYDDRLDFGTVVQHSGAKWAGFQHANAAAQAFQAAVDPTEAQFVGFSGYEWSLSGAHRNVTYRDPTTDLAITDRPELSFETPAPLILSTVGDFLAQLDSTQATSPKIAIVHHPAWRHDDDNFSGLFDWGRTAQDLTQPLAEIFSCHGSSEQFISWSPMPEDYPVGGEADLSDQRLASDKATIRDAFALGYRFGLIGSSDRHFYSFATCLQDQSYERIGLAFVAGNRAIPTLRQRVFSAFGLRHTYATTGARIYLDWTGPSTAKMGDEVTANEATLHLDAYASGIGATVNPTFAYWEVIRDDATVAVFTVTADQIHATWTDPSPLHGAFHAYWAKLVQSDYHVAWTTPVWVKVP